MSNSIQVKLCSTQLINSIRNWLDLNKRWLAITSCIFGDPFDIVGNALDVEVVVVEFGALLFAEIGASGRTRLNVARPVEDVRFSVGQIAEYSGAPAGIIKLQFH